MPLQNFNAPVSKKIRMTLACGRCRAKKVKCDFAHPVCLRCQKANATCSYAGSPTQLDLFNLIQVNETVNLLQKRVRSLEIKLQSIHENKEQSELRGKSEEHSQWNLTLTNQGLRIDTDIVSMDDLYHLFNSNLISPTPSSPCDEMIVINAKLWKSEYKTFPLYNIWEGGSPSLASSSIPQHHHYGDNITSDNYNEHHHHHDRNRQQFDSNNDSNLFYPHQCQHSPSLLDVEGSQHVPQFVLDRLMGVYQECFICLNEPWYDDTLSHRYFNEELDPLLANAIFAWSARHGAIYHGLFQGQDPNLVGEPFFEKTKELLKDRFTTSDIDTVHALLIIHNYVMGKTGIDRDQAESEAYMYLGLAIRMTLDLKMNKEVETTPVEKERNRRFYWLAYFLETLCTLNIGKPMSLPDDDNNSSTVEFPAPLNHEVGPIRWRVEFMSQRFRVIRIYRRLMELTTVALEKQSLSLQAINALEKQVKDWYAGLELHFQYDPHDPKWKTANQATWMRDLGCLKLNIEYHYTMMQIYSLVLESSSAGTPLNASALEISRSSADKILELIESWSISLPKEAWCYFAVEPVMVTVRLYTQLIEERDEDSLVIKGGMKRIADILEDSPVIHSHMVRKILDTIYVSIGAASSEDQSLQTTPSLDYWSSNLMTALSSSDSMQQPHVA
ncbi:hypothetical protein BDC45DRAFT_513878 [Circinella umbellata]|nr:hypothetical protein BDC45DRAFT_513878 [Circinella umbellata]